MAPNGDIIVADTRADRVQALHPDGTADSWARYSTNINRWVSGSAAGQFEDPTAVAVDPRNGDIFTAEGGQHRVQRLDSRGQPITVWGGTSAASTLGRFREPLGIAVTADGTVWVADTRNNRLQRLDPVTRSWSQLTGFTRPTAVAALSDGRIAVTELGADAVTDPAGAKNAGSISVLSADGPRVASLTGLDRPEGVVADGQGGLLVAETQRDRILHLRLSGDQLVKIAELGGPGAGPGHFARPMGMAVLPDGDLLVADTYNNRLQRFERTEQVEAPAAVGGTVPATLALTLTGPAQLGAFVPGTTRNYDATLPVDVVSTAGDAALALSDPDPVAPGRLVNGAFALARPLAAAADPAPPMPLGATSLVLTTFTAPVSHAPIAIRLRQTIHANDPLRTGSYTKSLTFTLSTTTP